MSFFNREDFFRNPLKIEKMKLLFSGSMIGASILLYVFGSRVFSDTLSNFYYMLDYDTAVMLFNSPISRGVEYIIYSLLCVLVPFLVFGRLIRLVSPFSFKLVKPEKESGTVLVIIIALAMCVVGNYASFVFESFTDMFFNAVPTGSPSEVQDVSQISAVGYFMSVLSNAVAPAIVEELAIRGVVMQPLRRYGDKFAIVISSVVFSLIHGNFQQIPFAFIVGLGTGYAVIRTGSIFTGMLLHFINNFWAVSMEYLSYLTEENYYIISYAVTLVICLLGVISAILLYKKDVSKGITEGVLKPSGVALPLWQRTVFTVGSPLFFVGCRFLVSSALGNFIPS